MASQAVDDFLTRELKVSNNIVSFRLLSRQLSIHVDEAKRELESFHATSQKTKEPVFATYILTGFAAPDVQADVIDLSGPDECTRYLVTLASESDLEDVKARFATIQSQHIHSLSPIPLKERGVLTTVAERVRKFDKQKGKEHAGQLGMLLFKETPWVITSKSRDNPTRPNVAATKPPNKVMAPPNKDMPSSSNKAATLPTKALPQPAKPAPLEATTSQILGNDPQATKELGRQATLNFGSTSKKMTSSGSKSGAIGNAKSKMESRPSPINEDTGLMSKDTRFPDADVKTTVLKSTERTTTIVGKGKRILDSSDEDEPAPTAPAFKRKKSHVTSDEDEEPGYQSATVRQDATSLQAMMDVDDDGVVNGRSTRSATPEHVLSARETAAAAKAARAEASKGVDRKERASRKRVPKGKKRVIKTRRVKNAKGYMVTEDYSSFEDVDPDETAKDDLGAETGSDNGENTDKKPTVQKETSGKAAAQKPVPSTSSIKRRQSESGAKKTKQSNDGKPGQQKLASFFGKK